MADDAIEKLARRISRATCHRDNVLDDWWTDEMRADRAAIKDVAARVIVEEGCGTQEAVDRARREWVAARLRELLAKVGNNERTVGGE